MCRCFWLICIVLLTAFQAPTYSNASEVDGIPSANAPLYLDVIINNRSKKLIAEFIRDPDGRIRSRAAELRELGVDPGVDTAADNWVYLDTLVSISYEYDASAQQIRIKMDPSKSTLNSYSARGTIHDTPVLTPGYGAAVNYSLSANASSKTNDINPAFNGGSVVLDGWAFSPHGSLFQSGSFDISTAGSKVRGRRLDSFWTKSLPEKQMSVRVGDMITSGLRWTRPIRMGGVQVKRNFATRPDLITQPLPSFEGTAAVPSTVDVYLGKLRLSSTEVDSGRFKVTDLPSPTGNGELRVVVEDANGKRTEQVLPFGTNSLLLRQGLVDYSVEAGVARRGYASPADNYDNSPIATASLRFGFTDTVTLEAHGEAGDGLLNSGAGALFSLGKYGTLDIALAGSIHASGEGGLASASYSYGNQTFSFRAESRRLFSNYLDLADVTSVHSIDFTNLKKVTAYDRLFAGIRLPNNNTSLGAGYSHTFSRDLQHRHFATATLGHSVNDNTYFTVSGQAEITGNRNYGVYAGLSITLGEDLNGSVGTSYSDGEFAPEVSISKSRGREPGNYGYSATIRKGKRNVRAAVRGSYLTKVNDLRLSLDASNDNVNVYGTVEGGLAFLGGGVFASRRINDSFAVVDAKSEGVTVYHENRPIGKTDKRGKLLVPDIRSYESNKVSIEPDDLPIESTISETQRRIALPERSGVVIRFEGEGEATSTALVTLVDAHGGFIEVGSTVKVTGFDDEYVVGYDGQAFISNLRPNNTLVVELIAGTCSANVAFIPRQGILQNLGKVVCQ